MSAIACSLRRVFPVANRATVFGGEVGVKPRRAKAALYGSPASSIRERRDASRRRKTGTLGGSALRDHRIHAADRRRLHRRGNAQLHSRCVWRTRIGCRRARGGSPPKVNFVTPSGQSITFPQGGCTFAYHPGERVRMLYDAGDPAGDARVDSFGTLWFTPLLLGALGVIFLIVAVAKASAAAAST